MGRGCLEHTLWDVLLTSYHQVALQINQFISTSLEIVDLVGCYLVKEQVDVETFMENTSK